MKHLIACLALFLSASTLVGCFNKENGVTSGSNGGGAETLLVRFSNFPLFTGDHSAVVIVSKTATGEILNYKIEDSLTTDTMSVRMHVSQTPYDVFVVLTKSNFEIEIGGNVDDFFSTIKFDSYIYNYRDSRIFENIISARNWQLLYEFLGVEPPNIKVEGVSVSFANDSISVSWNEVAHASSYEVFYARGGFVTTLDTKIETNTTNITLPSANFTRGEMYTFAIVATLDDGSKGEISEPVSIIIPAE